MNDGTTTAPEQIFIAMDIGPTAPEQVSWPIYLCWLGTLLGCLFLSFVSYIMVISFSTKHRGSMRRNMNNDRWQYKSGRAGFLALCYFIRATLLPSEYQWLAIIPAALVLMHRRCCVDFVKPFLRIPRPGKFVRTGFFLLVLRVTEWYTRMILVQMNIIDQDDTTTSVSMLDTIWFCCAWTVSTAYHSLLLMVFGACAGNIELTVLTGLLSTLTSCGAWPNRPAELRYPHAAQVFVVSVFLLYLHHALCFPTITWYPFQVSLPPPTTMSVRFWTCTIWIQLSTLFGFTVGCYLCSAEKTQGWKNMHHVVTFLSRTFQRLLFQLHRVLLQLDELDELDDEGGFDQRLTQRTIAKKTTASAIGALRLVVVFDINRTNTTGLFNGSHPMPSIDDAVHHHQERQGRQGGHGGQDGFRRDDKIRAIARAGNAAVCSVVLLVLGIVFDSAMCVFMGMCWPVLGLLLRLSPFTGRGTHRMSSHLMHVGCLCLAMVQTWMLLLMVGWAHVYRRRCRRCCRWTCWTGCGSTGRAKQRGDEEAVATKEAKKTTQGTTQGATQGTMEGTGRSDRDTRTTKEHTRLDPAALFERAPLLRSSSVPLPRESTRAKVDHALLKAEAAAENSPTRECCVCYDDVSVLRGVLCRRDEQQAHRRGLPVHFTCDVCLQSHASTEFPSNYPEVMQLTRLGRGDGGLYCPCHPGHRTTIIRTPSGGGGGETKGETDASAAVSCCAPPYDVSLLATHLEKRWFERCLAVRRYVGEQKVFEDTTAKWQERYDRALSQIKQQQIREDRSILAEQLKRQFPNARQCKQCGHGPILHFKCSDLTAHHGQVVAGGVTINNACVKCKWFSGNIRDWPMWNGELDEELDVSSVDPATIAAAAGGGGSGGGGGGGGGGGEGETKLQASARRTRDALTTTRRALLEALDALALLNGEERPARPAETAAPHLQEGGDQRRRLTPDLQRMVDEQAVTREQALEMMPPMAPLRVPTPPRPPSTATAAQDANCRTIWIRVAELRSTIERLEEELVEAELAVATEARALATGDDGTLEVLDYSTVLVSWRERGRLHRRHEFVTLCCLFVATTCATLACRWGRWATWVALTYFFVEMSYLGQFTCMAVGVGVLVFWFQCAHESVVRLLRDLTSPR